MGWARTEPRLRKRVSALLQPFRLGTLELPNRIVMAPHTTAFTSDAAANLPTDRHVAYYRERARGGVGLIITEGLHVHSTSFQAREIDASRDDAIPRLAEIVAAVHDEGARLIGQIMHTGGHGGNLQTGWLAPSAIPWSTGAQIPHELVPHEIAEIAHAFAATARRLELAGFDGVEVHVGHGHLLHQFLSPAANHRLDAYGGDAEGRARAVGETLKGVAEALSPDKVLGIRVSADDFLPGGLSLDDSLDIIDDLLGTAPIDYVHVSHSMYLEGYTLATQIADMSFPPGAFRQFPAAFKHRFPETAVIAICRLDDPGVAISMIEEGAADLIAMARQFITDPAFVAKLSSGELEGIRSCIHCNQGCVGRLEAGSPITCVVNPEVGYEAVFRSLSSPPRPERVLVVGGGPAGLQCAVAARARGHAVRLVDAGDALGGQVRHAAALSGREEFALLVDELADAAARSGVEVELGRRIEADEIDEEAWTAVAIATGSRTEPVEIPGAARVWTVVEALSALDHLGAHVLIWDREGSWAAAGLAEHLARAGKHVSIVSPAPAIAWGVSVYSKLALLPRLAELGVDFCTLESPVRLEDGAVVLAHTITGRERRLEGVSSIVAAGGLSAEDSLFRELAERGYPGEVYLLGDAFAPRSALEAVFDGKIAGASIGVPEKAATALPGRRGHRFSRLR
jgi:2,4-dienoyl-CoA reductase-like NADH-dependent reductase (Old Yellow Enzyme family)/thioredoxin reductase